MCINLYFSFSCLSCFLLVKSTNHVYSNSVSASTSKEPTLRVPCFHQRKLKLFMVCASMHGNGRRLSPQPISASQSQLKLCLKSQTPGIIINSSPSICLPRVALFKSFHVCSSTIFSLPLRTFFLTIIPKQFRA